MQVKSSFATNEGVNTGKESRKKGHAFALEKQSRHSERHVKDRLQ